MLTVGYLLNTPDKKQAGKKRRLCSVGCNLIALGQQGQSVNTWKPIPLFFPLLLVERIVQLPLWVDFSCSALSKFCNFYFQLDILMNNAGRSQRASWETIETAVDRQIFELNVFSVISLSRLALEHFLEQGSGHLAVTSSIAGVLGVPFSGSYTGSKHAIHVSIRHCYIIIF